MSPTREETIVDGIAAAIQEGHVNKLTSHQVALNIVEFLKEEAG